MIEENLPMRRMLKAGGLVLLAAVLAPAQTVMPLATQRALIAKYCATCHNDELKTGGFSWASVDLAHPEKNAERVEDAIRKLRAGVMPPSGMPRPDAATAKALAASLEAAIDKAASPRLSLGKPLIHRLNRDEYHNSIRDLLDLDVDVASLLPADVQSHGFDNMADVQTISPALMDGYIRAAGKISRLAVGDTGISPFVTTYQLTKEVSQLDHVDGAPIGTRGGMSVIHNFPVEGDYVFKLSFYYSIDGPLFGKIQGKGEQIEVSINGERIEVFDIDPLRTKWIDMQSKPVHVKAGPQRISAAFLQNAEGPLEDAISPLGESLVDLNEADKAGLTSLPHLHDFAISGPFNVTGAGDTPSRRRIFVCKPESSDQELPCARNITGTLMRRAYRRPVTEPDMERVLNLYQKGRNEGSFDSGIRMALQALIANPEFVYRFERQPAGVAPGAPYRISDLELASRLSYFIWSSAPDDELLSLAAQNKLHDAAVLEKQMKRMLGDPKTDALTVNFASQWLHLRNLKDVQPDPYVYPSFNKNLADSMRRETELFFGSIVSEDRSITDLLTADYTFVDELLARHYGIPNVLGSRFRKVQWPDANRRGLLGQASILTLTSVSNRTSPVQRGKYVMEVLLGTPPPPPPPNVPPLKENAASGNEKQLSVRERMEQHRATEPCASCHKMMDPIGFSLENFDGVGAWRVADSGRRIDVTGQLFDGTKLDGPVSLREAVLKHTDSFAESFTESLLTYALGRVTDYRYMPAVRAIEREAAKDNNRFSAFVLGIVKSEPFQMNAAEETTVSSAAAKRAH
jgi:Protein of unknown function (DUF1592)/Protein of unknown function (DUF1588)/Protein of unknown function (DUF1587)/Protein of unknown function (DUF1585)/Protein of unknown function (DUF1595)/Cytochrome C oxidase, cbb3-type, subunit III